MGFTIGANLYACFFDYEAGKYVAKSIGPITNVSPFGVSCGGVQFSPGDDVFSSLEAAETAAAKRNVAAPKPAEEVPSSPHH
jgi:hypothetical protein